MITERPAPTRERILDAAVELFGRRFPSPWVLCPIGVLEMAHRDADLAVARAARATGVPMVLSSLRSAK